MKSARFIRPASSNRQNDVGYVLAAVTDQLSLSHTPLNLKRRSTRLLQTLSSERQSDNHQAEYLIIHFAISKIIGLT